MGTLGNCPKWLEVSLWKFKAVGMVKALMCVTLHVCAYAEFLMNVREIEWIYMTSLEYMFGYLYCMNEWLIDAFESIFMNGMMYYMNAVFFFNAYDLWEFTCCIETKWKWCIVWNLYLWHMHNMLSFYNLALNLTCFLMILYMMWMYVHVLNFRSEWYEFKMDFHVYL